MSSKNLLNSTNGRFLTFGLLYISEGIPYGFTSIAMVAFMRQHGVSLEQIGAFVGAMALAYATLSTIQVDYGLVESQIAEVTVYNTVASGIGCLLGGWQGIVAERFDYAAVFYLDSPFVIIPLLIIPFLRNREESAETVDGDTDLTFSEAQPAES